MARTCVNIVGNSLAALVIAKWEGHKVDMKEKNIAA
jgi:proton glutamate symport protein